VALARACALATLALLVLVPSASAAIVGQWSFEGNFLDSSSTANNATNSAAPDDASFVTGRFGQGAYFDGNDYATTAANAVFDLDTFSVEVWFNVASSPGSTDIMLTKGSGGNDNFEMGFRNDANCAGSSVYALFDVGGANQWLCTPDSNYVDGRWHQAVMTVDGVAGKLYLDGQQRASLSYSGNVDNPADGITLGSEIVDAADVLTGLVHLDQAIERDPAQDF
jgi:hypothetical protein